MQFDKGIWAAAWDVYRANWKTVVCAIAAASAYDLFMEYMGESGGSAFFIEILIWSTVAISAHGTVLLGGTDLAFTDKKKLLMPFVSRSMVLALLSLVPGLIAFLVFLDERNIGFSMFMAVLAAGLAALIFFALLGTWLPAVVAGGNRRIGTAIDRAERTFFYSASRLLLGPGLLQAVFLGAGLFLLTVLPNALTGEVFGTAGFSFVDLLSLPIIYAVKAFTTTLLAVILSRAYLIAEHKMAQTSPS